MASIKTYALLLCFALLVSCGKSERVAQSADSPQEKQVEQSPRRTDSLEQALLGHWQIGSTELYFGPSTLTRIERGGSPEILNYTVHATDAAQSTLLLKMSVPTGWHWREVRFSSDRKEFSQSYWLEGDRAKTPSSSARFVDTKQRP